MYPNIHLTEKLAQERIHEALEAAGRDRLARQARPARAAGPWLFAVAAPIVILVVLQLVR